MTFALLIAAVCLVIDIAMGTALQRTINRTERPMEKPEFCWLDGTALKVFIFRRGTKEMRISAGDYGEAIDEAAKHNFSPPFTFIAVRSWRDHAAILRAERAEAGCRGA